MSKVHFVTFGCDRRFCQSRQRITKEAKDSGWFDKVFTYSPSDLDGYNKDFNRPQGAGYWWWKATVQLLALQKIDDGDFLLYLDAGFHINKHGKNIFDQYINDVRNNSGLLAFACHLAIEKKWTKRDLFKLLDCDSPEFTESDQIASGLVIYRKNKLNIDFLKEYQKVSFIDHAINDDPSYNQNYEEFITHRHDQSIFGLLIKKIFKGQNIALIYNEPFYADEVNLIRNSIKGNNSVDIKSLKLPFYAARIDDLLMRQI
jgi:hypothetical protein